MNVTSNLDRGSNQAGTRAYNERLVLSLVRRQGGLAKADIARSTGLSPQTVSIIMRSLEKDGLLLRGKPIKGRVGQPSVPMHLAADGAYSIGLKIGRRSADLVLMDFLGTVRQQLHEVYAYPLPQPILEFAIKGVEQLTSSLPASARDRVAGIGIATPFELWNWAESVGAPSSEMDQWREMDLAAALDQKVPLEVFVQNDATSACGAELVLGRGAEYANFCYFFIGYFIGGGIVLNNAVYTGPTGYAGAFGPMPMPAVEGVPPQLLDVASIFVLEEQLRANGYDQTALWEEANNWRDFGEHLDRWVDETARNLAYAIVASCSVIDFSAVIIDGGFPEWVREAVVEATMSSVNKLDLRGVKQPDILQGDVGANARAMGGALLPFFARYLADQNVLFKASA